MLELVQGMRKCCYACRTSSELLAVALTRTVLNVASLWMFSHAKTHTTQRSGTVGPSISQGNRMSEPPGLLVRAAAGRHGR